MLITASCASTTDGVHFIAFSLADKVRTIALKTGVENVFSNRSGPPDTLINPRKLYGAIICFILGLFV